MIKIFKIFISLIFSIISITGFIALALLFALFPIIMFFLSIIGICVAYIHNTWEYWNDLIRKIWKKYLHL